MDNLEKKETNEAPKQGKNEETLKEESRFDDGINHEGWIYLSSTDGRP
ncbi:MAG: hypothetical protein LBU27_00430 [Candidatus Peribacteria bacterium]|nr:hypothetical protein [Candidatus Peribacteria bacterium]